MDSVKARRAARELQLLVPAPSDRRAHTVVFHGLSMLPLLQEGDEVAVEPVPWEAIRVGDIVTYRQDDKFPTRRVVHKEADRLVLWCENWPTLRFSAGRDEVLGRAVARRRAGVWLRARDAAWRVARWRALARYHSRRLRSALAAALAARRLPSRRPGPVP
jgi:hypothetical protein